MKVTISDALAGRKWSCIGKSYRPATVTGKMFQNIPAGTVAAKITVRLSSLDWSHSPAISYGLEQGATIVANETKTFEGSYEYLDSIYCDGEPGVTEAYIEYYGADI